MKFGANLNCERILINYLIEGGYKMEEGGIGFFLVVMGFLLFVYLFVVIKSSRRYMKQFQKDCRLIDCIDYGDTLEQIKAVIRDGANINGADENGDTPLMGAARNNRHDLIEFLINAGANICHKNKKGETVMDIVKENNLCKIEEYLNKVKDSSRIYS